MGQSSGRELRRGKVVVLSREAGLLLPGPLPLSCLPSPLPLPVAPPHTPQGSQFRFAVESLRGLIPSSITLHPCGGAPLVYFLSPGCPHHPLHALPHPSVAFARVLLPFSPKPCLPETTCLPFCKLPQHSVSTNIHTFFWPVLSLAFIPSLIPLTSQNFITPINLPLHPTKQ